MALLLELQPALGRSAAYFNNWRTSYLSGALACSLLAAWTTALNDPSNRTPLWFALAIVPLSMMCGWLVNSMRASTMPGCDLPSGSFIDLFEGEHARRKDGKAELRKYVLNSGILQDRPKGALQRSQRVKGIVKAMVEEGTFSQLELQLTPDREVLAKRRLWGLSKREARALCSHNKSLVGSAAQDAMLRWIRELTDSRVVAARYCAAMLEDGVTRQSDIERMSERELAFRMGVWGLRDVDAQRLVSFHSRWRAAEVGLNAASRVLRYERERGFACALLNRVGTAMGSRRSALRRSAALAVADLIQHPFAHDEEDTAGENEHDDSDEDEDEQKDEGEEDDDGDEDEDEEEQKDEDEEENDDDEEEEDDEDHGPRSSLGGRLLQLGTGRRPKRL